MWKCLIVFVLLLSPVFCEESTVLKVSTRTITVNGKEAKVYALVQPDGTYGYYGEKGSHFNVILENLVDLPTSIHWHGLILPNFQDGVAFITQYAIYPGTSYHYNFPLVQSGTFWMHSHYSLEEQELMVAPLILIDPKEEKLADQDVVVMLNDFSFTPPLKIFEELRCNPNPPTTADIVEVKYDAFLANYRTLDDPEIIQVKPNDRVRLRMINSSSATNFFVLLGKLEGEAIAFDGNRVHPLKGTTFEVGIAERLDIIISIPEKGGVFPILAQGEGTDMQAGVILATDKSIIPSLTKKAAKKMGAFSTKQITELEALHPLKKKAVDQKFTLILDGDMQNYVWTINGQSWPNVTPLVVEENKRIEITFKNVSIMSHPMHFHGHVFQVTAVDGKAVNGAVCDTILVLPKSSITIQFDSDNPGAWPLHCHNLYHLEAGMLTVLRYKNYIQPLAP